LILLQCFCRNAIKGINIMAYRIDYEKIGSVKRTDEGYLEGDAIITRAGVFRYFNADGSPRFELRHPDDVFKADSMSSLKMKPVSNLHPNMPVNSKNVKHLQVGVTGENVSQSNELVKSTIKVFDSDAITAIEKGTQELSAGYTCDMVEESGEYNGEKYTHRQKNIKYNHVALVPRGRAGRLARLNLDSEECTDRMFRCDSDDDFKDDDNGSNSKNNNNKGVIMAKLKLDSAEHEVPQEVVTAYNSLLGEKDVLKSRCDTFEKRDIDKEIREAVASRRVLETAASTILKDAKFDAMSDIEIKTAVVKQVLPDFKVDSSDAGYIDGCFATAVSLAQEKIKNDAAANNRGKSATKQDKQDSLDTGSVGARSRYEENLKNAYKGKK
jgi:uncharacterized protein